MKRRSPLPLALAAVAALLCVQFAALAAPIEKTQLTTLLKFLEQNEVVQKIQTEGVAFDADDATLDELRQLGVSEEVLSAIKAAANAPKPAPATQPPITYDEVKALVSAALPEARVLRIVQASQVAFTLGADQERELRALGASDAVIAALKATPEPGEVPDLVIILDCSGSMQAETSDGIEKMAAAKKVVADLIARTPDGLRLSLIVYGHDKRLECRAVAVLQPLTKMNSSTRERLISQVDQLRPVGATPIALALDTANQELLRAESPNCGVILVSDGKETCRGNPSREAAELVASLDTSFGLHVVGFDVSEDEQAALNEIRAAAGDDGHYYEARNTNDLERQITEIIKPIIPEPERKRVPQRRGLKVAAPSTMPLPALGRIGVTEAGGDRPETGAFWDPEVESPRYDATIPISSADDKYDVYWIPKEGQSVLMLQSVTFEEKVTREVRPEDCLALVTVKGTGLAEPKAIAFTVPGGDGIHTGAFFVRRGQTATAYGQQFVVPAGEWDLWVQPADGSKGICLGRKMMIEPGVLNEID